MFEANVRAASDRAFLLTCAAAPGADATARVVDIFRILAQRYPRAILHPAYTTILVEYDPDVYAPEVLRAELSALVNVSLSEVKTAVREFAVPVLYDGPDLDLVARHCGLSREQVIALHTGPVYTVAFLGFAPGFPYLLGLPRELHVPRLSTPRVRVPAGAVGLAGGQTGIYPSATPGGWQLIGRTDAILFSPNRTPPSLLSPGDRLRFKAVRSLSDGPQPASPIRRKEGALRVLEPGLHSSVQGGGFGHWTHFGVGAGGAADPQALHVGNRILGNPASAGALELTLTGGQLEACEDLWVCVTGAPASVEIDGRAVEMWQPLPMWAGQRLKVGACSSGMRTYVHLRGGFTVEWPAHVLRADDCLARADLPTEPVPMAPSLRVWQGRYAQPFNTLRITAGPQRDWFEELAPLFNSEYTVSHEVSRQGLRLHGPTPRARVSDELVSEGVANGAIQIPYGGEPVILFCEQRTTGGYPKIANVIGEDLWKLGQIRPGDKLRFVWVES